MKKYALLLSYTGGRYRGWQKQSGSAAEGEGGPSIQGEVEGALARITGEEPSVVASGRTDSGVHAAGQVAHFVLKKGKAWEPELLRRGLNSALPVTIRALGLREAPLEFHAQRSAVKKQYSFYFQQGPCALPHLEPYSWWILKRLDLDAMRAGLAHLVGEHDFKPFQSTNAKVVTTTVRTILEADVTYLPIPYPGAPGAPMVASGLDAGMVRVRLVGTGFLKQMVRGIAGTLLQVGERRRDPSCFAEILRTLDRSKVGATAPGRALWLERVWYPAEFGVDWWGS